MAGSPNIRLCPDCRHKCHCDDICEKYIGVGMSDKSVPCGCKECKCEKIPAAYDRGPTIGTIDVPGESWDMFLVRKLREDRLRKETNKVKDMPNVDITIYYENKEKKKLLNIDKSEVDKIVEFHSKPVNGKVIDICIEDCNPNEMDLDGYYALLNSNKE